MADIKAKYGLVTMWKIQDSSKWVVSYLLEQWQYEIESSNIYPESLVNYRMNMNKEWTVYEKIKVA